MGLVAHRGLETGRSCLVRAYRLYLFLGLFLRRRLCHKGRGVLLRSYISSPQLLRLCIRAGCADCRRHAVITLILLSPTMYSRRVAVVGRCVPGEDSRPGGCRGCGRDAESISLQRKCSSYSAIEKPARNSRTALSENSQEKWGESAKMLATAVREGCPRIVRCED